MRILVAEDRIREAVRRLDATFAGVTLQEYQEELAPQLLKWQEATELRNALAADRPFPDGDVSRLGLDEPIFGANNPPDPANCLYQYTNIMTLPKVRNTRSLKFRALQKMNDPQEALYSLAFQTGLIGPAGSSLVLTPEEDDAFRATDWAADLNSARGNIKIGSFCMDTVPDLFDVDLEFAHISVPRRLAAHRGYAHPRMWAQYGDSNRGVCLVLDHEALHKAVVAAVGDQWAWGCGPVTYVLDEYEQSLGFFDARDLLLHGPLHGVLDNSDQALLTKHADWAHEAEFRFFVASDTPEDLYIPILPGVILGLVLGPAVDPRHFCDVRAFARDFGISSRVRTLIWTNGRAELV